MTMTLQRFHVGKRLSEMAIHNGTVYLAGQVADDPTADITGQTQQVLAAIDKLLIEAGTDKTRLLSTTIYIATMADFPAMNAVWDAWVPQGNTPPRATVEAKLANPSYKVEMQVIAAVA
jgi:enamine deaminase RidA (YjgF/YER057c/UK114 family)